MPLPEKLALFGINRVDVVRYAGDNRDLFRAAAGVHAADNQRRKQRVHLTGLVIELELPQELHVLDVGRRERFFVLLPGGPLRVAAVGQPIREFAALGQSSRAPAHYASKQQQQRQSGNFNKLSIFHLEDSLLITRRRSPSWSGSFSVEVRSQL